MARKGLMAALEEIEQQEAAASQSEVKEKELAADTLETDMIETTEAGDLVSDTSDQIEAAAADAEQLEDIADKMEDSLDNGGMDETSAEIAEVAVESIMRRQLGDFYKKQRFMPATEGFGMKQSRLKATQIAMEDVKSSARKIWDTIVEAAKRALAFVKDFFAKLFNNFDKLGKRADSIIEQAKSYSGPAVKFKNDAMFRSLNVEGKLSAETLKQGLAKTASIAEAVGKSIEMTGKNFGLAVDEMSKGEATIDEQKKKEISDQLLSIIEGYHLKETLPGNKVFTVNNNRITIAPAPNSKEYTSEEVEGCNSSYAGEIAKQVKTVCSNSSSLKTMNKEASDAINEVVSKLSGSADSKEVSSEMKKYVRETAIGVIKASTELVSMSSQYLLLTSKYALDYAEKSVSGKAEKKKETK